MRIFKRIPVRFFNNGRDSSEVFYYGNENYVLNPLGGKAPDFPIAIKHDGVSSALDYKHILGSIFGELGNTGGASVSTSTSSTTPSTTSNYAPAPYPTRNSEFLSGGKFNASDADVSAQ